MDPDKGDTDIREQTVFESIVSFLLMLLVAGIVELNSQHRHPVILSADEEIHMLLADFVEGGQSFMVVDEVGEARLADDLTTP